MTTVIYWQSALSLCYLFIWEMNKIIHTTIIADQLHVTTIVYAIRFLQLAPN